MVNKVYNILKAKAKGRDMPRILVYFCNLQISRDIMVTNQRRSLLCRPST